MCFYVRHSEKKIDFLMNIFKKKCKKVLGASKVSYADWPRGTAQSDAPNTAMYFEFSSSLSNV